MVSDHPSTLPSPEITICLDLPGDGPIDLQALPAKSGVFILEHESGGTLALASTANLRRMIKSKLQPPPAEAARSRRTNYRSLAKKVLAMQVGSAFEADWAYLQLARQRLPDTYKSLLDRWQAWFIHCDPASAFPQFVKTAHPRGHAGTSDVFIGPFPDKHAAGRYVEMLEDAFDLCRYHHILVQAPSATACAYKEMGRCRAPCDGSISMDEYRRRMAEAIDFTCTPIEKWRADAEKAMHAASAELRFEDAQRWRQTLERTQAAARLEFARVDRLERFVFLALARCEAGRMRPDSLVKVFLIRGGFVEPVARLSVHPDACQIEDLAKTVHARAKPHAADFSPAGIENIGMTCWHLFRPRTGRAASDTVFLRLNETLDVHSLAGALRQLERRHDSAQDDSISEREADNLAAHPDHA